MSMRVTKYITPLLAGTAAVVAVAAAPTAPQQIISPATGAAREPSASLPATFRSRPPAPGSVSPLWRPGLSALPPLSWWVGHGYRILVAGIERRRRGRGAVGRASHGCETVVSGLSRVMRRCCIRLPVVLLPPQPSRGAST